MGGALPIRFDATDGRTSVTIGGVAVVTVLIAEDDAVAAHFRRGCLAVGRHVCVEGGNVSGAHRRTLNLAEAGTAVTIHRIPVIALLVPGTDHTVAARVGGLLYRNGTAALGEIGG